MPEVPSPCVRNCCLDGDDICLGCFRTMEEIIQWGLVDDDEKRKIMVKIDERQQKRKEGGLTACTRGVMKFV